MEVPKILGVPVKILAFLAKVAFFVTGMFSIAWGSWYGSVQMWDAAVCCIVYGWFWMWLFFKLK